MLWLVHRAYFNRAKGIFTGFYFLSYNQHPPKLFFPTFFDFGYGATGVTPITTEHKIILLSLNRVP